MWVGDEMNERHARDPQSWQFVVVWTAAWCVKIEGFGRDDFGRSVQREASDLRRLRFLVGKGQS